MNVGPWGTEKLWNWGLMEQPRGCENGVLRVAHTRIPCIPFSGKYPLPPPPPTPPPRSLYQMHAKWCLGFSVLSHGRYDALAVMERGTVRTMSNALWLIQASLFAPLSKWVRIWKIIETTTWGLFPIIALAKFLWRWACNRNLWIVDFDTICPTMRFLKSIVEAYQRCGFKTLGKTRGRITGGITLIKFIELTELRRINKLVVWMGVSYSNFVAEQPAVYIMPPDERSNSLMYQISVQWLTLITDF